MTEKEIIEQIKNDLSVGEFYDITEDAVKGLLDLYNKQQKEIEELKNGQIDFWISDKEIEEKIKNKFISKDKIIEMIKELEFEIKYVELDKCSQYYDYTNYRKFAINRLYELLEEGGAK